MHSIVGICSLFLFLLALVTWAELRQHETRLSVQPEEHALDEELCLPEPDLIAEDEKQSPLDSRSSTCMPLTLGEMVDFDAEDVGADSRHSFFLRSLADGTDYSRPPNRTLHDHHNSRMKGFLKAAWLSLQASHGTYREL